MPDAGLGRTICARAHGHGSEATISDTTNFHKKRQKKNFQGLWPSFSLPAIIMEKLTACMPLSGWDREWKSSLPGSLTGCWFCMQTISQDNLQTLFLQRKLLPISLECLQKWWKDYRWKYPSLKSRGKGGGRRRETCEKANTTWWKGPHTEAISLLPTVITWPPGIYGKPCLKHTRTTNTPGVPSCWA